MEIVIDIPDEEVPNSQEIIDISLHFIDGKVCECTYPYIVLPKGHGRLIDADEIEHYMLPSEKQDKKTWFVHSEEYRNAVPHFNHAMRLLRDNAQTIIEADKAESEE